MPGGTKRPASHAVKQDVKKRRIENMISGEEENYMRLCMLLDICRKAVQIFFDEQIDPQCLKKTIGKGWMKLKKLRKTNVLSDTQWKILQGNTIDSSDFDIPLMICLLRNLTDLDISDLLPHESRTEKNDELARIKFHRNSIAHGNRSSLSDERFVEIWETICKAIRGMSYELFMDCERLNFTGLDLLNIDIKLRIKNAFKELAEFKKLHEELTKEWEIQQEKKTNPIPPNLRVKIDKQLKGWTEDDVKYFISTNGSKAVLESIEEHACVAVTGSFGMGKTAIIHSIALSMRAKGYIVVPVTDPMEIKKYKHPIEKNLFVVDNIFGICDFDEEDFKAWNKCGVEFDEKCKLLVSCQLQVYNEFRYDTLNDKHLNFHECNLLSDDLCLSLNERQSIAETYGVNMHEIKDYIELYNCFPLLCKHFTIQITTDAKIFFENPFEVFKIEFKKLQTLGANGKVCALLTLLMFNDDVPEVMLTGDINWDDKVVISNTSKACKLNTQNVYLTIKKELETLIDIYVVKKAGIYHTLNERMFNFLILYFGEQMTESLIKFACSSFIMQRFQFSNPSNNQDDYRFPLDVNDIEVPILLNFGFEVWDIVGQNAIILSSTEYRDLYVNRLIMDWSKGKIVEVFNNPNSYHIYFYEYLNFKDRIELTQLFEKTDKSDGSTALILYLKRSKPTGRCIDPAYYCKWLIDNGCRIDIADYEGKTAIFYAAENFTRETIEYLMNKGADINICSNNGYSPLFVACQRGHDGVTNALLRFGADSNTLTEEGYSPLHPTCYDGNTSIVTNLLQYNAKVNVQNYNGDTPLLLACWRGHSTIVKILLQNGADSEISNKYGCSPLHAACCSNDTSVLNELLKHKVDVSKKNAKGQTPFELACLLGHHNIIAELNRHSFTT